MSFTQPLIVKHSEDNNWTVYEPFPFYFYYNLKSNKVETSLKDYSKSLDHVRVDLIVPKDFNTDFASVPRLLHGLFSPYTVAGKPAVTHDFVYRTVGMEMMVDHLYSKVDADRIFLLGLKIIQAKIAADRPKPKGLWSKFKYKLSDVWAVIFRQSMYLAVKLFGHKAWESYR